MNKENLDLHPLIEFLSEESVKKCIQSRSSNQEVTIIESKQIPHPSCIETLEVFKKTDPKFKVKITVY